MATFLGNPDYSPVKGYSQLQGDLTTINTSIFIQEGKIVKSENDYIFCLIPNNITGLSKPESFKKGSPTCFTVHTKEYSRWVSKDKPNETTQPTALETTIVEWLNSEGNIWLEKSFSGTLQLNGMESVLNAIKDNQLWHILAEFLECEPNLIKDISVKSTAKKTNSTPKESDRLIERYSFVIQTCGVTGIDAYNFMDLSITLAELKKSDPEIYETLFKLLELVL